jgi:hypothetical protein
MELLIFFFFANMALLFCIGYAAGHLLHLDRFSEKFEQEKRARYH